MEAGRPPNIAASIDRAISLSTLEAQSFEGVLEHLLIAWRASRSQILAEAIDAVSAKLAEGVAPIEGRTYALRHKAWLARDENRRHADVPILLESISTHDVEETTEAARRLLAWEPDPRVTMPLLLVMRKTVRFPLTRANDLMELLASVFQHHLDPRVVEPLMRRDIDWRVRMKAQAVLDLAGRIAEDYPLTEADQAAILRVRDFIVTPLRQRASAAHDIDALYQAVYDDPEDDGARAVLSDALLQTHDPRGRLIALTLGDAATLTKEVKKQANALLERHGDEFLGALKPYLRDVRFQRGFLASAIVSNAVWNEERREWIRVLPKELLADRTWCTAHTLYFRDIENMDVVYALVSSPKMRALRTLGFAGASVRPADASVRQLVKLDQLGVVLPERIERFHLCGPEARHSTSDYQSTGFEPAEVQRIATTPALKHIKHLELHGQGASYAGDPRPEHYAWLWGSELGQRIEDLTLVVKRKTFEADRWMTRDAEQALPVKRLVFVTDHFGDGPRVVLHRGEEGKRLRSIECSNLDADSFRAIGAMVQRSDVRIEELVFHGRSPVASVRRDLDAAIAAARQRPKKLVFSAGNS